MRTVAANHDRGMMSRTRLGDRVSYFAYVPGSKVRALLTAAQDNVHVLIPTRLDDGSDALFRDPLNACGWLLEYIASTATVIPLSVPFLEPIKKETLGASLR